MWRHVRTSPSFIKSSREANTPVKSMKLIEQERFGGYNTKSSVKQDTTIHVKFGEGADEECMK